MYKIFISYAKEDKLYCEKIILHLESVDFIQNFSDGDLVTGDEWNQKIHDEINESDGVIILLSKKYLSKDFIKTKELRWIEARVKGGNIQLFPILINQCMWEQHSFISKFSIEPDKASPLENLDEDIKEEKIKKIIYNIVSKCKEKKNDILSGGLAVIHPANLAIIPVKFSKAVSEKISDQIIDFYKSTAESVLKLNCLVAQKDVVALALCLDEYKHDKTYNKILDAYNEILSENENIDILIIDYCHYYDGFPGNAEQHLFSAMSLILTRNKSIKILLFVEDIPPEEESMRKYASLFINESRLIYVAKNCGILPDDNSLKINDINKFKLRQNNAFGLSLPVIKVKLIRRVGHFQGTKKDGIQYCNKYFYDGSECEKEIADLIEKYIVHNYDPGEITIFYYLQISKWLHNPILVVSQKLNIVAYQYRKNGSNYDFIMDSAPGKVLVILPFIDAGESAKEIIRQLKKNKISDISILSIMASGSSVEENIISEINVDGENYSSFSFLRMERGKVEKEKCSLCQIDIPYSTNIERYNKLTAFNMWTMANEIPWIDEDENEATPRRKSLKNIPNFYQIIHNNGAWLTYKIRILLRDRIKNIGNRFPEKPVLILCPNEKGANALADHLNILDGYNVVGIPKEIINYCIDNLHVFELIRLFIDSKKEFDWFKQLNSAGKGKYVFVLEEFSVTGSSKAALINIAKYFDLDTICHISMFDFNPNKENIQNVLDLNIPTISLYQFQISGKEFIHE